MASANDTGAPSPRPSTIGFRPDPGIWSKLNKARARLADSSGLAAFGRGLSNQDLLTYLLNLALTELGIDDEPDAPT